VSGEGLASIRANAVNSVYFHPLNTPNQPAFWSHRQQYFVKMTKQISLIFIITLLFAPPSFLRAQSTDALASWKQQYPDENALYLHMRENLNIGWEAGQLAIHLDHDSRLLFLNNTATGLADRAISYSSFSEILNIDASTQVPNKERYRKVPVLDIRDVNTISGGVFYDDRREKSFVFPSIQEGAMADLRYRENILEPRFLGAFHFRSYLPVVDATYTVTVDTGLSLRYILLGRDTSGVRLDVQRSGNKQTYRWTATRQPAMLYEENSPSLLNDEPHVVVYLDHIGQKPLLNDAAGLYRWYRELTAPLGGSDDEALQKLTATLIEGANSDREKARRIFVWVQDNIRYVAFEDGLGGFIPREAPLVCQRKFGDCKDMANLLTTLLNQAGLPAQLTWVGTRDIPYRYDQVPTPLVDNHMIATLELDGELLFLDATDNRLGFGYPSSFIQGKQAMIGQGDEFKLVEVPEVSASRNRVEETAALVLSGTQVSGTGLARFRGYPAFSLREEMKSVRPEGMARFLSGALQLGNNKFSIPRYDIRGADNREEPLEVAFDLSIPDYARAAGGEIYLNMHLDRRYNNSAIDEKKRKRDVEMEFRIEHVHNVSLAIPEGYRVAHMPANCGENQPHFGFAVTYRELDQTLYMERTILVDELVLQKADFEGWNRMVNGLTKAYQDLVVLEKIPSSSE